MRDVTTQVLPRWAEVLRYGRFLEELRNRIGNEPTFVGSALAKTESENRPAAALEHRFELAFQAVIELLGLLLAEAGIDERDADQILYRSRGSILTNGLTDDLQRIRRSRNTVQHGHSISSPESYWEATGAFIQLLPQTERELRKAFKAVGVDLPS
jgi:hypothetical protein